MYTSFYKLKKKPFQISSDPAFMWLGEKHKEALATLKYGILDNKGFLLLTGDVGTGKTTLINALLQSLDKDIISTTVPDPALDKLDFFNYIAASFGIENEFATKGNFLVHFRRFLIQANENNKKVLLIIDEAQLLTQELLEEIRLLSNIEKMDTKLINIFFVGQNEFNEILNREQNRAVRQRLTLNYNIDPLTPDETIEYIAHRLKVAGAGSKIFSDEAAREVFIYSGGFPRRINVICDHTLLSGYVQEEKIIIPDIVKECARELKIPAYVRNRDINGFDIYKPHSAPVVTPVKKTVAEVRPTYQPEPAPKQPFERKQQSGRKQHKYSLAFILVCLILLVSFFILSPENFKTAVENVKSNAMIIRDRALQWVDAVNNGQPADSSGIKQEKEEVLDEKPVEPLKPLQSTPGLSEVSSNHSMENTRPSQDKPGDQVLHPVNESPLKTEPDKPDQETAVTPPDNSADSGAKKKTVAVVKPSLTLDKHEDSPVVQPEEPLISDKKKIEAVDPLPDEKLIIRFKYNTNDFTEEGFKNLVAFAQVLRQHPEAKITITGYTDSEGYAKYNRKLSEFRANIVKSFFLGKGINSVQIETLGRGSKNPIESNDTAWGRMMNRRVEIEIRK